MTNRENIKQLVLEATLNELPRLTDFLEGLEEEWQWEPSLTYGLNLEIGRAHV